MKFGLTEELYNEILRIANKYEYEFKIFGSRARGDYKKNSDIDIAIMGNVTDKEEYEIKNEFDLIETAYSFDIVFVDKLVKTKLRGEILKEGEKIE